MPGAGQKPRPKPKPQQPPTPRITRPPTPQIPLVNLTGGGATAVPGAASARIGVQPGSAAASIGAQAAPRQLRVNPLGGGVDYGVPITAGATIGLQQVPKVGGVKQPGGPLSATRVVTRGPVRSRPLGGGVDYIGNVVPPRRTEPFQYEPGAGLPGSPWISPPPEEGAEDITITVTGDGGSGGGYYQDDYVPQNTGGVNRGAGPGGAHSPRHCSHGPAAARGGLWRISATRSQ